MCGISGIFKNVPINKRDIKIQKILLKEIKHRGPSSKGMSKAKNYITACSRLSIVDQRKVSNIPFETSKNILRQNLHQEIIKNKKIGFTIPFFSWITKNEILKILKKTNFFKLNIFNLKNFEKLINNRKSLFKYRMLVWQIISFCVWEKQHRYI